MKKFRFPRIASFCLFALLSVSAQAFDIAGTGTVWRAADGDTFWVTGIEPEIYRQLWQHSRDPDHFNSRYFSVKMRVGGVDTAESNHKDKRRNTKRGKEISQHMATVSQGQRARFRCWTIGDYGRPICAIGLQNVGDIGLYLIENRFSRYVTFWGRHPYYHQAYSRAASR